MKEKIRSLFKLLVPPLAAFGLAGYSSDMVVENLASLTGVITLTPVVAEAIKVRWGLEDVILRWNIKAMKLVSWGTAIVLVFVSNFLGFGFGLGAMDALTLVGYGIGAGLVANEVFTLETVKRLLLAIF